MMEITQIWQKFRKINVFTKGVTEELIWRKKFSVRENYLGVFFFSVILKIDFT